jgi:hypothetical protein
MRLALIFASDSVQYVAIRRRMTPWPSSSESACAGRLPSRSVVNVLRRFLNLRRSVFAQVMTRGAGMSIA